MNWEIQRAAVNDARNYGPHATRNAAVWACWAANPRLSGAGFQRLAYSGCIIANGYLYETNGPWTVDVARCRETT